MAISSRPPSSSPDLERVQDRGFNDPPRPRLKGRRCRPRRWCACRRAVAGRANDPCARIVRALAARQCHELRRIGISVTTVSNAPRKPPPDFSSCRTRRWAQMRRSRRQALSRRCGPDRGLSAPGRPARPLPSHPRLPDHLRARSPASSPRADQRGQACGRLNGRPCLPNATKRSVTIPAESGIRPPRRYLDRFSSPDHRRTAAEKCRRLRPSQPRCSRVCLPRPAHRLRSPVARWHASIAASFGTPRRHTRHPRTPGCRLGDHRTPPGTEPNRRQSACHRRRPSGAARRSM